HPNVVELVSPCVGRGRRVQAPCRLGPDEFEAASIGARALQVHVRNLKEVRGLQQDKGHIASRANCVEREILDAAILRHVSVCPGRVSDARATSNKCSHACRGGGDVRVAATLASELHPFVGSGRHFESRSDLIRAARKPDYAASGSIGGGNSSSNGG